MNSARWFIRREADEPPRAHCSGGLRPPDLPARRRSQSAATADAKCLKCGSYDLRITGAYDEGVGEARLIVLCGRCRQVEHVPLR